MERYDRLQEPDAVIPLVRIREGGDPQGSSLPRLRGVNIINALNDWEAKVEEYFADLQAGIDELKNAAPLTEEEQHEIFQLKKQVVNTLVDRVTVNRDRELTVTLRLNLLKILEGGSNSGAVHLGQFGTYTHIPDIYRAGQILMVL